MPPAAHPNAELMILSALSESPAYGYLIQKRVELASEQQLSIRPGTLYRLLQKLEAKALIRSWWDTSTGRDRKWYELTEAGRATLERQATSWRVFADCVWNLLKPGEPRAGKPEAHA